MQTKSLLYILFLLTPFYTQAQTELTPTDPDLMSFELDSLVSTLEASEKPWLPFINGENVLTGIYSLKAGAIDKQQPHGTDEVYYVVSGKGKFRVEDEERSIQAGSILFVKAHASHNFFDIVEDLVMVVFFDK